MPARCSAAAVANPPMPAPTIATESFVISLPRSVLDSAIGRRRRRARLSNEADIVRNRIMDRKRQDCRAHGAFVSDGFAPRRTRPLALSLHDLAPFRAVALIDRNEPGLVVGLVDHLGRQHDL